MTRNENLESAFSALVARLDFPMYVVTTAVGDRRGGCLVGFGTEASIDPQRFLVGLSVKNHTTTLARSAVFLAVHLLGRDAMDLARLFGEETGDEVDKFAQCDWSTGPEGMPILRDAAAWFTGRIVERFELGDHVGHLLEPTAVVAPDSVDFVMFDDVQDFDPGHDA